MKKMLLLGLGLSLCVACNSSGAAGKIDEQKLQVAEQMAQNAKKFPKMVFEKTEHDFGTIKRGTPVETIFTFTNQGDAPLVITNVQSTCGCTVPEKPEQPIAPGESGHIKVNFNGSGSNQVQKSVTVTANTETGTQTLTIRANVQD